jgi:hypothetical protein
MSKDIDKSFLRDVNVGSFDKTDVKINNTVLSEKETRKNFLKHARVLGCEQQMLILFAKYDNLLRNCTNEKERVDIGKLGTLEIYRLLGATGDLYVNGELVVKDS